MSIKHFFMIVAASTVLTFSMALVMYDSVDGLGAEQHFRMLGVRG